MAELDEVDDYHFYGTEIEVEEETRRGQHRKEVRDPSATRALPLHKQEVTDEQGRRRFHGAFTGGFSAGYFNTVGSKEGWQPSEFRSSRENRAAVQQSVEQYLDEDELEELRRTNLQTTADYDTFGSTAAELARRAATDAAAERPSAIPGLLPDELVVPVAQSVGIRLLQKMGWKQGKGIGAPGDAPTAADEEEEDSAAAGEGGDGAAAAAAAEQRRQRCWGQHASIAAENTPLYLLAPKTDVHGLGFDPFKGAEDFRRLKQQRQEAARPKAGSSQKRRRGIAFGSGVLDEEDGYGQGTTLDDYVTHDDVGDYDDEVDAGGMPRSRVPKLRKGGLGDRLAQRGYSFEIMDDDDEDVGALSWHPAHRQQQYALPGREATLMLQSKEHVQGKGGLVPGFVRATAVVTLTFFPPPRVPPDYVPLHRPAKEAEASLPAAVTKQAPPQAEPPSDADLRQAIDSLAFFVARNGIFFENMARQRQQREGRHAFLSGGEGAAYYRWKVHSLKSIIQPQQQRQPRGKRQQHLAIGQRSAPLSADERGALLGEQPLASAAAPAAQQQAGWAAGAAGAAGQAAAAAAIAAGEPQQALRRQLLQVAEGDRQRLQQLLSRNFVTAESQDMLQPEGGTVVAAGLRPGAPARPAAAASAAASGKLVTDSDLARPVDAASGSGAAAAAGSSLEIRPGASTAALVPGGVPGAAPRRLPVRRSEEWRPAALLCKRLNVPDPYHGRPAELQMSRFRTDHLALPDTAAAVASSLNAVPAGAQDFLLPPSVAAAMKEAEAKQQLQLMQAGASGGAAAAAAPGMPPGQQQHAAAVPLAIGARLPAALHQQPPQPHQQDAAGAADAFLSSLSDMLGGGGAATEAAPPLPTGPSPSLGAPGQPQQLEATERQQEEAEEAAGAAERPVDLFKAIFEDSEEDEEEQEDEQAANGQPPQQGQQQQPGPAGAAGDQAGQGHGAMTQQAQQAQQPGEEAAFGFAKLRQQAPLGPQPPHGPPSLPSAGTAAAVAARFAAAAGAGALDEETKQRVQEALRALRKDKKEKKEKSGSKKKKKDRKKEKEKKSKHKGSKDKDKARKQKRSKEGSKHKHRRNKDSGRSTTGTSSGGSSSGSSGSDID